MPRKRTTTSHCRALTAPHCRALTHTLLHRYRTAQPLAMPHTVAARTVTLCLTTADCRTQLPRALSHTVTHCCTLSLTLPHTTARTAARYDTALPHTTAALPHTAALLHTAECTATHLDPIIQAGYKWTIQYLYIYIQLSLLDIHLTTLHLNLTMSKFNSITRKMN
jgi:hypothetical protein